MTTNKTTGFANYIKAQKGYERDYYLTGNITEPRGVKTATARSQTNKDQPFPSYQEEKIGYRDIQNRTMNAISRSSANPVGNTYARRRIIVAKDKPPIHKQIQNTSTTGSKLANQGGGALMQ